MGLDYCNCVGAKHESPVTSVLMAMGGGGCDQYNSMDHVLSHLPSNGMDINSSYLLADSSTVGLIVET